LWNALYHEDPEIEYSRRPYGGWSLHDVVGEQYMDTVEFHGLVMDRNTFRRDFVAPATVLPALEEDDMAAFVKLSPAQADPNDPDRVWAIGLHTKRKLYGTRKDLAKQLGIPNSVKTIEKATLDSLTEVP
jgi:hypothetical protein